MTLKHWSSCRPSTSEVHINLFSKMSSLFLGTTNVCCLLLHSWLFCFCLWKERDFVWLFFYMFSFPVYISGQPLNLFCFVFVLLRRNKFKSWEMVKSMIQAIIHSLLPLINTPKSAMNSTSKNAEDLALSNSFPLNGHTRISFQDHLVQLNKRYHMHKSMAQ